ncbi:unnamed protein product [Microthlaspi erraticum]|uniref:Uncharacterized protein n=1 Tax=Microthlaspi erraticum TaxID=1685480 RepID=A0A6D2J2C1_9BRAS|nr:unnamed protein product [Microthlaspi erraticum]
MVLLMSFGAFWSIWDIGAWRDLAHGSSSTGHAKEEGRSHLEDQLDRPLDQPVEFLNSTGQASTRSSWGVKVKPEKCCFPLDFPLTLNLILLYLKALSHEKTTKL